MKTPRARAGFALPSAIFLLVILAALAAFVLSVSTTQHAGAALDIEGARAYQAARAGIEWGVFQSLRNASCGDASLGFAGTGLAQFTVAVRCTSFSNTELASAVIIDQITATACNQAPCPNAAPGMYYVERQVTVSVQRK